MVVALLFLATSDQSVLEWSFASATQNDIYIWCTQTMVSIIFANTVIARYDVITYVTWVALGHHPFYSNSNSNSKMIYLTKSTSIYQQDIINIQKMTLIVGRLLLWYNMYRFRESHPVNTNRQCHNCHIVYPLPWLAHWKANFEYILFSLSSGWLHRIEYEEHWSFFDRRATRTILGVNQ